MKSHPTVGLRHVCLFPFPLSSSPYQNVIDIIGCLVTGVVLMVIFLVWQHYLEKALAKPTGSASPLTPPPIMKLSLWKKSNGMLAALMCISFLNFASFLAWFYWIQVNIYIDILAPILALTCFSAVLSRLPSFDTNPYNGPNAPHVCHRGDMQCDHGAHSPSNALGRYHR